MKIVDVAKQYFNVKRNSYNTWVIVGPKYDSVVLYEDNDTYCRFSTGETGDIYTFLRRIVGLQHADSVKIYDPDAKLTPTLSEVLKPTKSKIIEAEGFDYQEFVGKVGYNAYIASRGISPETAAHFELEVDGPDVLFPLYNDTFKRIGSIKRNAYPQTKADRYRTMMLHGHVKPCCWDLRKLAALKPDDVVILVEGTWSVMRIWQVVGHLPILPVATMGTALQPELFDYIGRNRVVAILDNDTGGERYRRQLHQQRCRGKMVHEVTLNNHGQNLYVDDLSDEQMKKLFSIIM